MSADVLWFRKDEHLSDANPLQLVEQRRLVIAQDWHVEKRTGLMPVQVELPRTVQRERSLLHGDTLGVPRRVDCNRPPSFDADPAVHFEVRVYDVGIPLKVENARSSRINALVELDGIEDDH